MSTRSTAADFAERIIESANDQLAYGGPDLCPDEQAELDAVLGALERAEPSLASSGPTHPYWSLRDAITRLWVATHDAGVRDGAAAEQVRQSTIQNRTSRHLPPVAERAANAAPTIDRTDDIARQRAILNDPLRFADVMTDHLFYRVFDALFLTDREPAYARFVELVGDVTHAPQGPRLTAALLDLEEERYNTAGLLISDIGIPMGIAIERTRHALVDCLNVIYHRDPSAMPDQRVA